MVSSFSNTFLKRTWLIIYLKRSQAVCFKARTRLAMRLTYGSLKPSAGAAASERRLAAEIQLIKGKHICLSALDLHIKTRRLVQEMWKTFQFQSAELVDCEDSVRLKSFWIRSLLFFKCVWIYFLLNVGCVTKYITKDLLVLLLLYTDHSLLCTKVVVVKVFRIIKGKYS